MIVEMFIFFASVAFVLWKIMSSFAKKTVSNVSSRALEASRNARLERMTLSAEQESEIIDRFFADRETRVEEQKRLLRVMESIFDEYPELRKEYVMNYDGIDNYYASGWGYEEVNGKDGKPYKRTKCNYGRFADVYLAVAFAEHGKIPYMFHGWSGQFDILEGVTVDLRYDTGAPFKETYSCKTSRSIFSTKYWAKWYKDLLIKNGARPEDVDFVLCDYGTRLIHREDDIFPDKRREIG